MPSYIQVILHASARGRNLLPHESLAKSHQENREGEQGVSALSQALIPWQHRSEVARILCY